MGIAWITSYPKSGNTWVRFLLAGYLSGSIQDTAQVAAAVPDIHQGGDPRSILARQNLAYVKTHLTWSPAHPYAELSDRAVVVVRNPKDVLLSNMNYQRLLQDSDRDFSDAQYIESFIEQGGDWRWNQAGYGSLEEHTHGWLDDPTAPRHLLVRYESLKADAASELARILSFLDLPADPARIAGAVSQSSFDTMRALEVRERRTKPADQASVFPKTALRAGKTPRYFMNQGRTRGSLAHISPELDRAFDARFAALIERFGYGPGDAPDAPR